MTQKNDITIKAGKLEDIWLKAAVVGSLWASFEIIVGSLLHNLRIPFAGTILTVFAVLFVISFFQIWPQKGMVWRAGLICALMKSISPSAVILGPMIGIFTEALIIEIFIRLIGRNLPAYVLGGAFAALSALLQKIVNLIILYGFDLVEIYVNLFNFASRQLNLPENSPVNLLILLGSIYLMAGMIAAMAGYSIGKRALSYRQTQPNDHRFNEYSPSGYSGIENESAPSGTSSSIPQNQRNYSLILLLTHFLIIVISLYLFSTLPGFGIKAGIAVIYVFFCLMHYPGISRRLLKPLFWLQLFVIMFLAALFLEYRSDEPFAWQKGLAGGLEMLFRAMVVISGFSAISTELSNPKIKNLLIRRGFEKVYLSLQLAFSALPVMIENNASLKNFLRHPGKSLSLILAQADSWLNTFKNRNGEV